MVLIREMEEKDKQAVLDMMRVFYDSPAVFHTSSDSRRPLQSPDSSIYCSRSLTLP